MVKIYDFFKWNKPGRSPSGAIVTTVHPVLCCLVTLLTKKQNDHFLSKQKNLHLSWLESFKVCLLPYPEKRKKLDGGGGGADQ